MIYIYMYTIVHIHVYPRFKKKHCIEPVTFFGLTSTLLFVNHLYGLNPDFHLKPAVLHLAPHPHSSGFSPHFCGFGLHLYLEVS